MVNLRSKSKPKAVASNTALKREATDPIPTVLDNPDLNEASLRKLLRAELQKLAMVHKVKANMKSELIIQQLLSRQPHKRDRPAEDDPREEPSRKRLRSETAFREVPKGQDDAGLPATGPTPARASLDDPKPLAAGPSAPRSTSTSQKIPTELPYDKELFSGTESEMAEEEQIDYGTPVSSRAGTPPPANVINLEHCVKIIKQVTTQDVTLLKEVTDMHDTAAKLRKRARDVRDLVKAEKGRRERVEAYCRYWQEIEPRWNREWLYGEQMVPDYKIKLDDFDGPAGPPTLREDAQEAQNLNERRAMRKPVLSPEELKRMRQAIVSKQEAEQKELEALRVNGGFHRFGPSQRASETAESPHDLREGSSSIPLDDNSADKPLMISSENSGE